MRPPTLQNLCSDILSVVIVWLARLCMLTALLAINASAQILSLTAYGTTSTGTALRWEAPGPFLNCMFNGFSILQDDKEIARVFDRYYVVEGLSPSTKYEFTVAVETPPLPSSYAVCFPPDYRTITVTTPPAENTSAPTWNSQKQLATANDDAPLVLSKPKPWGEPLNQVEVLGLLTAGESSTYLARLIRKQGIEFIPTPAFRQQLKGAGGEKVLDEAPRRVNSKHYSFFDSLWDKWCLQSLYEAYQLQKKEQFARAEKKLLSEWDACSSSPVSEIALGYILMRESKYHEAETQFRAAVEQWPDSPVAHSDLGVALFAEAIKKTVDNGYAASEDAASKAGASGIENMLADGYTGSEDIVSLWGQGEDGHVRTFLVDKQLLDTAIAEQRTANRLDPEYADAHGHLGEHLQWAGKDESGLNELDRAAKLDPTGWREARSRAYKRILLHVEVKNRE